MLCAANEVRRIDGKLLAKFDRRCPVVQSSDEEFHAQRLFIFQISAEQSVARSALNRDIAQVEREPALRHPRWLLSRFVKPQPVPVQRERLASLDPGERPGQ